MTQAPAYRTAGKELLDQATHELAIGDVRQASEKGWGAAAQMVKAVAEQRGWQHNNHASLYRVIDALAKETQDQETYRLFQVAGSLHTNFYENWETPGGVASGLQDVQRFLDKLATLMRT